MLEEAATKALVICTEQRVSFVDVEGPNVITRCFETTFADEQARRASSSNSSTVWGTAKVLSRSVIAAESFGPQSDMKLYIKRYFGGPVVVNTFNCPISPCLNPRHKPRKRRFSAVTVSTVSMAVCCTDDPTWSATLADNSSAC